MCFVSDSGNCPVEKGNEDDMYDFDQMIDRRGKNSAKWDQRFVGKAEENLLPFWVADTDFPAPLAVQRALEDRVRHNIYGYFLPTDNCRSAAADWQRRRHGFMARPEWAVFIGGIDAALAAAVCAYTKPGDGVLVQTPNYTPFFETVKNNGRKVLENPMKMENGRYIPDFEDFERKAKKAGLWMFCNPQNPTGRCFTKEELEQFARICLENDVIMVSDEIHGDIVYKGNVHIPMASLSAEICKKTITCTSPSKTFSVAGLASSVIFIADKGLRRQFENEKEKRCLNINSLGLTAMEAAYREGDEYADELVDYLQKNRDFAMEYIEREIPKIRVLAPEATFLLWMDCGELRIRGEELERFFIRSGVRLSMGSAYGDRSGSFARFNFGCPRGLLEEGLKRIARAAEHL